MPHRSMRRRGILDGSTMSPQISASGGRSSRATLRSWPTARDVVALGCGGGYDDRGSSLGGGGSPRAVRDAVAGDAAATSGSSEGGAR